MNYVPCTSISACNFHAFTVFQYFIYYNSIKNNLNTKPLVIYSLHVDHIKRNICRTYTVGFCHSKFNVFFLTLNVLQSKYNNYISIYTMIALCSDINKLHVTYHYNMCFVSLIMSYLTDLLQKIPAIFQFIHVDFTRIQLYIFFVKLSIAFINFVSE